MIYELKTNSLSVKIDSKGAELKSLIDRNTAIEYIWQGNPSFWNRSTPVLFPIVGQVEDGKYLHEGKEYILSQHGFARDMEFELIENQNNTLSFLLKSDAETLKKYPFEFELKIIFTALGNKLYINYEVKNVGKNQMYFQLGAHPGFNVPIDLNDRFEDYFLKFDKAYTLDRLLFSDGLLSGETEKNYLLDSYKIELNQNTFDADAIIFENHQIESVLITKDGEKGLKMKGIKGWPLFGIWSKPKANAPFVCLEPWYGVASVKGQGKDFISKKAIQKLGKSDLFKAGYELEICG
jgi:galactose mutarotase-like enzyme